jgi:hypothetical protein
MNNKQLRFWYRRYNKKWFQNKLPEITLRFAKPDKNWLGDTVFLGTDPEYIAISKEIKNWNRVVRMILLHEMVHVSLPVRITHGLRFEARMRSLARRKAFSGLW